MLGLDPSRIGGTAGGARRSSNPDLTPREGVGPTCCWWVNIPERKGFETAFHRSRCGRRRTGARGSTSPDTLPVRSSRSCEPPIAASTSSRSRPSAGPRRRPRRAVPRRRRHRGPEPPRGVRPPGHGGTRDGPTSHRHANTATVEVVGDAGVLVDDGDVVRSAKRSAMCSRMKAGARNSASGASIGQPHSAGGAVRTPTSRCISEWPAREPAAMTSTDRRPA